MRGMRQCRVGSSYDAEHLGTARIYGESGVVSWTLGVLQATQDLVAGTSTP